MITLKRCLLRLLPITAACLLATAPASAQQPVERLAFASCADDASPHLIAAILEIENVGGARADAHLDAAVAADPACPFARALRAFGHSGLSGEARLRALDRAVAEAATGDVAELVAIAALREWRRPATPARAALTEAAARLMPDEPYFAALGANTGDNAVRAERLAAVAERFRDHAATRNLLGYALYRSGSTAEGLDAIREYVRLLPDHPNPHDSYAELLQLDGRLDEAERHYRRAVELDPGYDQGFRGLAEVAALRGDLADARGHLESALAAADSPARRWPHLRALAFNAAIQGDLDAARRHLRASAQEAEAAGAAAAARNNRWYIAYLEAAAGNADEAARAWTAVREDDYPFAGLSDVYVYAALGDAARTAAGLEALERSARTNTIAPDALHVARLAEAAVRGDIAAARTHLAAIGNRGFQVLGHAFLARALRNAGDREGEAASRKEIEGYRAIDLAAAYARRLVGQ